MLTTESDTITPVGRDAEEFMKRRLDVALLESVPSKGFSEEEFSWSVSRADLLAASIFEREPTTFADVTTKFRTLADPKFGIREEISHSTATMMRKCLLQMLVIIERAEEERHLDERATVVTLADVAPGDRALQLVLRIAAHRRAALAADAAFIFASGADRDRWSGIHLREEDAGFVLEKKLVTTKCDSLVGVIAKLTIPCQFFADDPAVHGNAGRSAVAALKALNEKRLEPARRSLKASADAFRKEVSRLAQTEATLQRLVISSDDDLRRIAAASRPNSRRAA